jgi:ribosomal protein L11 methyltransferase
VAAQALLVTVPEADEDQVSAVLWEHGTLGVEMLPGQAGVSRLLAYFSAPASELQRVIEALDGGPALSVEPAAVPDVDWVARFRETFSAMDVGAFTIAPAWDRPARVAAGRHLLLIDPGRAFGTGTHETTRLCLRTLEQIFAQRQVHSMLDVGTGTGILAIAGALLGAQRVTALDNDPEALASARCHAALNGIRLGLVQGDGARGVTACAFDVIVANITAPLLRQRSPEILAAAAPGADVVLSGLLVQEADSVAAAYASAGPLQQDVDGEWACLRIRIPA